MATSHVVGGASAAFIGGVVVSLINHFFHTSVSDADALVIGGAVVGAGAGLGRAIEKGGIAGLFSRVLHGAPKAPVSTGVTNP